MRYWIKDKIDHLVSYVYTRRLFGKRCDAFHPDCVVCKAWDFHYDCFPNGKPDYTLDVTE